MAKIVIAAAPLLTSAWLGLHCVTFQWLCILLSNLLTRAAPRADARATLLAC